MYRKRSFGAFYPNTSGCTHCCEGSAVVFWRIQLGIRDVELWLSWCLGWKKPCSLPTVKFLNCCVLVNPIRTWWKPWTFPPKLHIPTYSEHFAEMSNDPPRIWRLLIDLTDVPKSQMKNCRAGSFLEVIVCD